ncbi:MAG TPA: cation:proton antiporter [Acidimicrobiia bacterium]|nr:cation:proton antiporter [Acidimicrobiia bacterium]
MASATAVAAPLDEHQMFALLVQLALLVGMARLFGALMRRLKQPSVVGEILAGVLLGPSVLGAIAPGLWDSIFGDGAVASILFAIAWLGILFLVVVIGFETDLGIIGRYRHAALAVAAGALVAPLVAIGVISPFTPDSFRGEDASLFVFAGFMGLALSVAALPVVAKILQEMGFLRRDFGQLTLAVGMTIDAIGWLLLGILTGIASGGFQPDALLATIGGLVIFVGLTATLGVWLLDRLYRRVLGNGSLVAGLALTVIAAWLGGAITTWLRLEAILGAFVVGVAAARARHRPPQLLTTLETVTTGLFGPVFFAYSGLRVDLGALADPSILAWTAILILVATLSKIVGTTFTARRVGLTANNAVALGAGLTALGAMGIVAALLGLNVGALSETGYAVLVVAAIATSVMAPVLLRAVTKKSDASPEEQERLRREELAATSQILAARRILIPTRGGLSTRFAATLAASVFPHAELTLLSIEVVTGRWWQRFSNVSDNGRQNSELRPPTDLDPLLEGARLRRRKARDPALAIAEEAALGYDLVWLGVTEGSSSTRLSPVLDRALTRIDTATVLVRFPPGQPIPGSLPERILVPVTASKRTRAAEELAYSVAQKAGAQVTALHVVMHPDAEGVPIDDREMNDSLETGQETLAQAVEFAQQMGVVVDSVIDVASNEAETLLAHANSGNFDLLVLGASPRPLSGRPFFGHTTAYLMHRSQIPVVIIGMAGGMASPLGKPSV